MIEVILKGKPFEVLRTLPRRGYKSKDGLVRFVQIYEIECDKCKQPKKIDKYNLQKGHGLRHMNCHLAAIKDTSTLSDTQIKAAIAFNWMGRNKKRQKKFIRLEFGLTIHQITNLIFANCWYCGAEPNQYHYKYTIPYNGIDRIDSDIGYTILNSVTCCGNCNTAKGTKSVSDFLNWLDKLAKHNGYSREESWGSLKEIKL